MKDRSSDLLGPRASRPHRAPGTKYFQNLQVIFALRAHCGRDARGPSKSLDWLPKQKAGSLSTSCPLSTVYCLLSTSLSSGFPTADVLKLFGCQRVDGQAERTQLEAGDFGIDFLWQQVNAGLQFAFLLNQILN